jgi:hypothetical protein
MGPGFVVDIAGLLPQRAGNPRTASTATSCCSRTHTCCACSSRAGFRPTALSRCADFPSPPNLDTAPVTNVHKFTSPYWPRNLLITATPSAAPPPLLLIFVSLLTEIGRDGCNLQLCQIVRHWVRNDRSVGFAGSCGGRRSLAGNFWPVWPLGRGLRALVSAANFRFWEGETGSTVAHLAPRREEGGAAQGMRRRAPFTWT